MSDHFDILIKNARLRRNSESLFDIGIANGRVVTLKENLADEAEIVIDAEGNLVTESFINPHLHLCKVYTLQMMDEEALTSYSAEGMGKAMNAIELAARRVGIEADPAVYYSRPEQERWWERMFMGIFGRRLPGTERGWLRYEWSPSLLQ